ncbi:MAG: hypothetical protein GY783_20575, partial [Gammaproteobacteria bacterium]|nr:hypothetical protein [Gammaproteobacteria bacterium]
GGGVLGIDGANTAGIDGANVLGIDGGGVLGIDGANTAGIDGANTAGIDGANTAGIDGANVLGIDGGGVLGIDGANTAGIDGANTAGIDGGAAAGIDGGAALGIDSGALLSGPVDSIDRTNGVFESMGQIVMASQNMLAGITVGDYVSVAGSVVSPGWLYADDVSVSADRYVPGATEVFVTGMLSSVDLASGTAQMGGLTIDYTSSLSSSDAPSGPMWSFAGIQPAARGVMVSDRSGVR